MPQLTADKLIGQNIYAARTIKAVSSDYKTVVQTFQPGDLVGMVYSWTTDRKTNKSYLMFEGGKAGTYYFVLIAPGSFSFTSNIEAKVEQVKQQEAQQKQADEIAQKGQFAYYFERYGKVILIALVGTAIITTYIKTRKK